MKSPEKGLLPIRISRFEQGKKLARKVFLRLEKNGRAVPLVNAGEEFPEELLAKLIKHRHESLVVGVDEHEYGLDPETIELFLLEKSEIEQLPSAIDPHPQALPEPETILSAEAPAPEAATQVSGEQPMPEEKTRLSADSAETETTNTLRSDEAEPEKESAFAADGTEEEKKTGFKREPAEVAALTTISKIVEKHKETLIRNTAAGAQPDQELRFEKEPFLKEVEKLAIQKNLSLSIAQLTKHAERETDPEQKTFLLQQVKDKKKQLLALHRGEEIEADESARTDTSHLIERYKQVLESAGDDFQKMLELSELNSELEEDLYAGGLNALNFEDLAPAEESMTSADESSPAADADPLDYRPLLAGACTYLAYQLGYHYKPFLKELSTACYTFWADSTGVQDEKLRGIPGELYQGVLDGLKNRHFKNSLYSDSAKIISAAVEYAKVTTTNGAITGPPDKGSLADALDRMGSTETSLDSISLERWKQSLEKEPGMDLYNLCYQVSYESIKEMRQK